MSASWQCQTRVDQGILLSPGCEGVLPVKVSQQKDSIPQRLMETKQLTGKSTLREACHDEHSLWETRFVIAPCLDGNDSLQKPAILRVRRRRRACSYPRLPTLPSFESCQVAIPSKISGSTSLGDRGDRWTQRPYTIQWPDDIHQPGV